MKHPAKLTKRGKTEFGLNLQQESFCQLYALGDRDTFGNGTKCYLEVYGPDYMLLNKKPLSYQSAMVSASDLLRLPKIIDRINNLLETGGFNDENVDKQHLFLINQHADFKSKLGAIKEYNVLKKRINAIHQNNILVVNAQINEKVDEALDSFLNNKMVGNNG